MGPALAEIERLDGARLDAFAPYHAVRADLLRRAGRTGEAAAAYRRALASTPGMAEQAWLQARLDSLAD